MIGFAYYKFMALFLVSHIRPSRGFTTIPFVQTNTAGIIQIQDDVFRRIQPQSKSPWPLASSFFGKFDSDEDDEDEDEDDDDDELGQLDDATVANFRSRMDSLFGDDSSGDGATTSKDTVSPSVSSSIDELISYARSQSTEEQPVVDWAKPADGLAAGVVLVANPAKFCTDFDGDSYSPSPTLLSKFGLTLPPPKDLGADRRADLLPVLMVVDYNQQRGARAVLLNRRTGYLLGDLEQPPSSDDDSSSSSSMGPAPILEKFCIQPLWFGGVDNVSSGLDMLHQCPKVIGAKEITEDGLYWGGDPAQAQEAMSDPSLDKVLSGFDFKFFVQSTLWTPKEIEKEVDAGTWFIAHVSKEVLFKSRDRMGTRRAKPLWTEICELMGGEFKDIRDTLYGDE